MSESRVLGTIGIETRASLIRQVFIVIFIFSSSKSIYIIRVIWLVYSICGNANIPNSYLSLGLCGIFEHRPVLFGCQWWYMMHVSCYSSFLYGIPVTSGDTWDKFLITYYLFLLHGSLVTRISLLFILAICSIHVLHTHTLL